MDLIKWQLNFGLCNFGLKSYLWFQIELALRARSVLEITRIIPDQIALHSVQLPLSFIIDYIDWFRLYRLLVFLDWARQEKDIPVNLYQNCSIFCSRILLNVLYNTSLRCLHRVLRARAPMMRALVCERASWRKLMQSSEQVNNIAQITAQAPVVQRLDNAIHRINHYPADKCWQNKPRYPLDSDLSGG